MRYSSSQSHNPHSIDFADGAQDGTDSGFNVNQNHVMILDFAGGVAEHIDQGHADLS